MTSFIPHPPSALGPDISARESVVSRINMRDNG